MIEMPVLDDALTGVAGFFTPIMLGLRFGRPCTVRLPAHLRRAPHQLPDRHRFGRAAQRPGPSLAVLEGLLLGETAPTARSGEIEQPALIVGHTRDPVHPFSDSGMLAEELRTRP